MEPSSGVQDYEPRTFKWYGHVQIILGKPKPLSTSVNGSLQRQSTLKALIIRSNASRR